MERLSSDLTMDIISRLPIKSVVRCKSVSKSWEALISDPLFAAAHFTPFSNYIISEEMDEKLLYFIEIEEEDNETSTISKHLNFPFLTDCLTGINRPILMGSCLGYVCFSARDMYWDGTACPTNPMYLFNPITEANILLPQFQETRLSTCVYGFGLDVSTQECKVLLVYLREKTFQVQVHTVGRDYSWRTNTVPTMLTDVTGAELANGDLQTTLPLGFNGSIHWIVLSSVKGNIFGARRGYRACILSFQLDTEVFGVIPMPDPLQVINPYFHNSMMYALQVSGGRLSIIYSPEPSFVDTWVMADYNISDSWVKAHSIRLNYLRISHIRPIGFRKNGELMLHLDNEGLVSYNTDSDRYTILRSCWTMPFPFMGSLISLKSAYGDNKVVGTYGFGNPIQKQKLSTHCVNGVYHVREPLSD